VLGALLGAAGWVVSDHLEQDNDFCNACHVSAEMPLHREIRRDFEVNGERLQSIETRHCVVGNDNVPFLIAQGAMHTIR
jgi:hypothetical protein